MKKWIAIFMAAVCTLSLTACGNKQPSADEVQQAIEDGNLTIQDALDKGYVTQEWVDDYIEQNSVPAGSKMEAGIVGDFTAATLSGELFTKDQLGNVTFFVFLDPADEDAEEFYQSLTEVFDDVQAQGAGVTVCIKNEENKELFEDAPFPVILYNDSLKAAVKSHSDMIEGMPNTASWYVNGSFLSAWYSSIDTDNFADTAADFVEISKQKEFEGKGSSAQNGMAAMGQ